MTDDLNPVLCVTTPEAPTQRRFVTLIAVIPAEEADDAALTKNSIHISHEATEGETLRYLQDGAKLAMVAKSLAKAVSFNKYGSLVQ